MLRLRNRDQFQAGLAGATIARTPHFALHRRALPLAVEPAAAGEAPGVPLFRPTGVWLGAMVPKRWARRAVTRNAIRRQIYALGLSLEGQPPAAYVVRLRTAFDRRQFVSATSEPLRRAVRAELEQLFARARRTAA
ncbi:ribonuclease P protein component [uncultured Pseudacidovorax sp.]|uniref:ribonuclease P protein component n=1 Tax=uncultured Pseudacidovorax sp. TaxID=679313 RepID=UPI0025F75CB1|nr:ribonuclease P protein component [uncultured Pseudacidovorax sp.]